MNVIMTDLKHRTEERAINPVFLGGVEVKTNKDFTSLISIILKSCSIDDEFTNRIGKANSAFGYLRERVCHNRNLRLVTKKTSVMTSC